MTGVTGPIQGLCYLADDSRLAVASADNRLLHQIRRVFVYRKPAARRHQQRNAARLILRQRSKAVEIGGRVAEGGLAEAEEALDIPAPDDRLVGIEIDREIEEVGDERDCLAVLGQAPGLQHVEPFHDQDIGPEPAQSFSYADPIERINRVDHHFNIQISRCFFCRILGFSGKENRWVLKGKSIYRNGVAFFDKFPGHSFIKSCQTTAAQWPGRTQYHNLLMIFHQATLWFLQSYNCFFPESCGQSVRRRRMAW